MFAVFSALLSLSSPTNSGFVADPRCVETSMGVSFNYSILCFGMCQKISLAKASFSQCSSERFPCDKSQPFSYISLLDVLG